MPVYRLSAILWTFLTGAVQNNVFMSALKCQMQNDPEMLRLGFLSMIFIILTEKNLCDWISDILMEATWENMSYIQALNLPTLMYPVSSISYKCLFYV